MTAELMPFFNARTAKPGECVELETEVNPELRLRQRACTAAAFIVKHLNARCAQHPTWTALDKEALGNLNVFATALGTDHPATPTSTWAELERFTLQLGLVTKRHGIVDPKVQNAITQLNDDKAAALRLDYRPARSLSA